MRIPYKDIKLCECGYKQEVKPGNRFLPGHNRRKNKIIINSGGYLMEYCPNHPSANSCGRVLKHRLVLEGYLGRYLESDEIPHHCNEKKDDNRIENIELMLTTGPESHSSIHKIGNKNVLGKRWKLKSKRVYSPEARQQMSERKKKQHQEGKGGGFQKGNILGKGRVKSE